MKGIRGTLVDPAPERESGATAGSSDIERQFSYPMKDLTQGSVLKHLIQMAAFLAVSMGVQTLYLLADLYWVGRLGKEAIAAVGVAGNLNIIVLALTQMLGVGTTTLIAQAAGRKDQPRAEVVFNQSFIMSLLVAVVLGVIGFLVRTPYANSLSADAATAALARGYLLWFIPGLLLQFPLVTLGSALRATGIIKPAVAFQILSVFLNMVLAPLLVFGLIGLPAPGSDRRGRGDFHFHPRRRRPDDRLLRPEV